MEVASQLSAPFQFLPEELVTIALRTLHDAKIVPIEWGAALYRRMGVPMMIKNFSYIIPDNLLTAAATTLSSLGLPKGDPDPFLPKAVGDKYSKASSLFRLTESEEIGPVRYLILYPMSYIQFTSDELSISPSLSYRADPDELQVLVPRPQAVYAALIRLLSKSLCHSSTRTTLDSELSQLLLYHLFGAQLSDSYDEDDSEDEEDPSVAEAILARGEEWMGDALQVIVSGAADSAALPYVDC
ncbi:hypothetical protein BDZ89DRAFT_1112006 [Hymenopellis radicata]|nr:hypothetical protein BDZ89DRAFT_1112006 [Hymenopellis radicata]